eukprot:3875642-Prymnesium_polylepis.1
MSSIDDTSPSIAMCCGGASPMRACKLNSVSWAHMKTNEYRLREGKRSFLSSRPTVTSVDIAATSSAVMRP